MPSYRAMEDAIAEIERAQARAERAEQGQLEWRNLAMRGDAPLREARTLIRELLFHHLNDCHTGSVANDGCNNRRLIEEAKEFLSEPL